MDFLNDLFIKENNVAISGLTDELNIFLILNKYQNTKDNILVLTSTLFEANKIYNSLNTYTSDVLLYPMDDYLSSLALATSPELKIKRLETLEGIKKNKHCIIITNTMGYLKKLPNIKEINLIEIDLVKNKSLDRNKLLEILNKFGYEKTSIVTSTGDFSVRGFVIDIFMVHEEHPIRLEFFGDEIESIRYFDESTQLTIKEIERIKLLPISEITTKNHSSLYDYLKNPIVLYYNYNQIMANFDRLSEDMFDFKQTNDIDVNIYEFNDIRVDKYIKIETLDNYKIKEKIYNYESMELENFNSDFELLHDFVLKNINNHKTVVFYLSRSSEIKEIQSMFNSKLINMNTVVLDKINIIQRKLNKGFIIDKYVVISEYDIENIKNEKPRYKNTYKIGNKIKGFDDIKVGDYVVHIVNGVGIYAGVKALKQNGVEKDYIVIKYLNDDKIYVPAEKINSIYKYSSKEGSSPKLNKLGTTVWMKKTEQVRKNIKDISEELIKLYSERESVTNSPLKTYPEEDVFASEFTFTETDDQIKVIKEIDRDLKSNHPMDRLLCGDVGFGKTEVALRAIFKTVMNGYQVAYLCPTTILSRQQYQSALERFKDYAVNIALINRFTSDKETKRILSELKEGKIDLIFGTHRLLSKDIEYKNLGLLVVDEEQRFGVTHKEKIKEIKSNINVLTLSATPIPRTLKMSLSGLRDLSVIDTPPVNRYPVQTYVIEENDFLVKDSVYKELARGGQIFILYNNVSKIEDQMIKLNKLIPEARIRYAHGQMNKDDLEEVIEQFVNNEFDILLCTTIIETGIDMPNVNTLIVYDADRFGLSQLYQLRGRVGRSNKIAYAYLMYNERKMLNDIAIKRLQAIKEFTKLGSGYKIAMRDLSLRGAGDLLGARQAGFIEDIGIDLYTKMINDEMKIYNGEEFEEEYDNPLINVDTHIKDAYVTDEDIKIEIHQKINEIDSFEKMNLIKEEIEDRFGAIDSELEVYMYEELFEKQCYTLGITRIEQTDYYFNLFIQKEEIANLKMDKIFMIANNITTKFIFEYKNNFLRISLPIKKIPKHFIYYMVDLLDVIINEEKNKN